MKYAELIARAIEARNHAYAPYSKFKVGAAVLTAAGRIYTGCNVENVAFGASVCAERTAILKAVSEGDHEFQAIAVVTQNAVFPCGTCRQVMLEFAPQMVVIIADVQGNAVSTASVGGLLPDGFSPQDLPR
jgi:cytidine deaminase